MNKYEKALELLDKYNQDIISEQLRKNKNEQLIEQVLEIDFEQLNQLYNQTKLKKEIKRNKISSIEHTNRIQNEEELRRVGEEIVRKGKYAVVTMAGGQRNKVRSFRTKRNF